VDPLALLSNPPLVHHGSRENVRTSQVFSVAAGCFLLACLPVGNPPAGQHVIADRSLTGVYLSPSEQDGVPSNLLVTGPLRKFPSDSFYGNEYGPRDEALSDLYAVPYVGISSPAPSLAGWQPVVGDFLVSYRSLVGGTIPTDSLGRLVFVQLILNANYPLLDSLEIERVDLATRATESLGDSVELPNGQYFALSSGRTRVYSGGPENRTMCDLQECFIAHLQSNSIAFVGEDFYYVDRISGSNSVPGGNLTRLKPYAPFAYPEVLLSSTGTVSFEPILGDRAPQLLLSLATDTGDAPFALLDTDTLKTSSFPPEKGQAQFVSASSDGHWLAFMTTIAGADGSQPADHRLFIYDWTTGGYATVDSARVGQTIGTVLEWRPGRAELWFSTLPDGFGIWRPNTGLTTGQANLNPYVQAPDGQSSVFTRDGRHWFSTAVGHPSIIRVGSCDDATAPLLQLNSEDTANTSHWETDDGRLLVGVWTIDGNRKDISLVDADAGTSRAIATAGHVVALGRTRALALLNWEISRATGDLTLIDLASGAQTVLAQDVYDVAVDRGQSANVPPGADALAPGTRVAFLTNNRLVSPWDGLWVASLP
jgi:hypothetical protein